MYVEIATATAKIALEEYIANQEKISNAVKRLVHLIIKGKLTILIFGAGGVGKSTLGKLLDGAHIESLSSHYKESLKIEKISLPGSVPCITLVAPGQPRRRPDTWSQLYKKLSKTGSVGIINVACWGYHSIGDISYKEHRDYRKNMTRAQFLKDYLSSRQKEEITALDEITPHIIQAQAKLWMISAITKQDLWWTQRSHVRNSYMSGDYASAIDKIKKARGANEFRHEYLSASLIPTNFCTGKQEILAKTVAGYDASLQRENLLNLLSGIGQLSGWA